MIELFGFWGNVSVITFILSVAPLFILYWVLYFVVFQITQDSKVTSKAMGTFASDNDSGDLVLFKKFTIPCLVSLWMVAISFVLWAAGSIGASDLNLSLVQSVSASAQNLAPFTGWVVFIGVIYFLFIGVLRKLYKTAVKVNSLVSKLK